MRISNIKVGNIIRENIRIILICLLSVMVMILAISQKNNYHVDETMSYSLANHVGYRGVTYEEGKHYVPSDLFNELVTVNNLQRFNYGNVCVNQKNDVHPPIYYLILHTICSFFPNVYTKWFAGLINIIFGIFTILAFRKIVFLLIPDERIADILSFTLAFSAEMISMVTFFRMYVVGLCFASWYMYFLLKILATEDINTSILVKCALTAIMGVLTHYYVGIFVFVLCVSVGICLLLKKKISSLVRLFITMICSLGVILLIWPYAISQTISGDYAVGFNSNFVSDFKNNIIAYWQIVNMNWFGGILGIILILLFVSKIVDLKSIENYENNRLRYDITSILVINGIVLFGLISYAAPRIAERYMTVLYVLILLIILIVVINFIESCNISISSTKGYLLLACSCALMITLSWYGNGFEYMYLNQKDVLDVARLENCDKRGVCINDSTKWKINANWKDMSYLGDIVFCGENNMDILDECEIDEAYDLIVYVVEKENSEEIVNSISKKYGYVSCKYLYSLGYSDTYILSRYSGE